MKKQLVLITTILIFHTLSAQVPKIERDALIALFNSTNGTNWTNNMGWNTSSPVPTWFGITVTNISGQDHVTIIDLFNNNLNGSLPIQIGDFTKLTALEISFNNLLSGNLPAQIGNLTNLERLIFWDNNLTGNIPTEIGNCLKLNTLSFEDNSLTGNIPNSFKNLTLMTSFWLNGNKFSGVVPNIFSDWKNLVYFSIGDANWTGSYNNFSGTLDFSNNPKMLMYNMDHNNISALNIQNGNNLNTLSFDIRNNPNLTCVFVDDAMYSAANWKQIDITTTFVETQQACDLLGTESMTFKSGISIYPNPTNSIINISNNGKEDIKRITLKNSSGQHIKEIESRNNIDISYLSSGIYIISFNDNKGNSVNYKLIKK